MAQEGVQWWNQAGNMDNLEKDSIHLMNQGFWNTEQMPHTLPGLSDEG